MDPHGTQINNMHCHPMPKLHSEELTQMNIYNIQIVRGNYTTCDPLWDPLFSASL